MLQFKIFLRDSQTCFCYVFTLHYGKLLGDDAFYFFNSFGENIADVWPKIDSFSDLSTTNYKKYTNYVYQQFDKLDSGTRIVTHCGDDNQIPDSYILKESYFDGDLKLWVKK